MKKDKSICINSFILKKTSKTVSTHIFWGILAILFSLSYPPSVALAQTTPAYYTVTSPRLNVRKQPSGKSAIIGGLSKGDTINVLTLKKAWAEIDFKKGIGYVSTKYIEPIEIEDISDPELLSEVDLVQITESDSVVSSKPKNGKKRTFAFRLTSSLSLGISNLYSFNAYSHPRFGFSIDVGTQIKAKFMPRGMYAETTIGFMELGNSNYSFPSLSINILPAGYRYEGIKIGKLETSIYAVGGLSLQIPFGQGIHFYRNSKNYSFSAVTNLNVYAKAGLELTDNIAVGIMYMHGITNVCRSLPIGIKNSTIQFYGTLLFDKWKKK